MKQMILSILFLTIFLPLSSAYFGYYPYQTGPLANGQYAPNYQYNIVNNPNYYCFNAPFTVDCVSSYGYSNAQNQFYGNYLNNNPYFYQYNSYPVYYNNNNGGINQAYSSMPPQWVNEPNYWYYG